MNKFSIYTLKALRKLYAKCVHTYQLPTLPKEEDPDKASDMIYDLLSSDKPCMIARFGSTELSTMINFLGVQRGKKNILKYIKGEGLDWWWNPNMMEQMQRWSGFFPPTQDKIEQFCRLMLEDAKEVDILGSWVSGEFYLKEQLRASTLVHLRLLEPFWSNNPWSRILEDKKVVVVHPFAEAIASQYENRKCLFSNPDVLPEFKNLRTVKAIQSLGGENYNFQDWFDALEWMKGEISKEDFDICLIGCGAYGFPLAAHVKRQGKKAIHLGGALQLLFGIRGKRWEDPNYGVKEWGIPYGSYSSLMNEYWVRPGNSGRPKNAEQVEGGCYW